MTVREAPETAARPGMLRAYKAVGHTLGLLVLVQAVLAGRGQFVDPDLLKVHGYVGNAVWLLAVAQVALAFLAGLPARTRGPLLGIGVALVVLVTAQIGLGYAGRDSGQAAALHLPNGVLIFGLGVAGSLLAARIGK